MKKEKERYVKKFGHDNPIKYDVVVSSINNFNARLLKLTLHEKEMVAAKSQLIQGPRIKPPDEICTYEASTTRY